MMKTTAPRLLIGGLVALGLGALGVGAGALAQPPRGGTGGPNFALASDIVAREIAFARAVREQGQRKAFRAFATEAARMFDVSSPVMVQAPVMVQTWAKGRKDPADLLQWTAQSVWMSCDGTVGVSYGAWHAGAAKGWFSTVWQRQKKGDYLFVLNQGGSAAANNAGSEDDLPVIEAKVAECPARGPRPGPSAPPAPQTTDAPQAPDAPATDHLSGESGDHTLAWATTLRPDGSRDYVLRMKESGAMREVLRLQARP